MLGIFWGGEVALLIAWGRRSLY